MAGEDEFSNEHFYTEVDEDLSNEIRVNSAILVDEMGHKEEISNKVVEFLKSGDCKLSKYYHLLKTHKIPADTQNASSWLENNGFPLRGIVSGCGAPTERLSSFVDHHLQEGMTKIDSFLQDTKHTLQVIEELNEKVEQGDINLEGVALVSLDVENIGASKEFLENRPTQTSEDGDNFVSSQSLLSALDLCLRSNYFKFNQKIYKQTRGVGTGIKLAPTYACLGLGKYEEILFESDQVLLEKILLWKRFIDDVLMLFSGSKQECQQLVDWLNNLMPGVIKFKFDFSMDKIEFLDLVIYMEDGRIKTNLFVKPTNKQLYLDYNSNHPQPL